MLSSKTRRSATLQALVGADDGLGSIEARLWLVLTGAAVLTGIYFRFLDFARWPLAADEYYSYRAVVFLLASGLPEFPCGGFYTRGLLYQYVTAPLLLVGLAPEAALRIVSILANLAMLPAAFLVARRVGGFRVAAATLIILALSTWEIEMARFGRMYTLFQAICIWYVYHLCRLFETGDLRRWRWLLGLSVAGPLAWDGGVLLAFVNFVPVVARRALWRTRHLASAIAILVFSALLPIVQFRYLGSPDARAPVPSEPMVRTTSSGLSWLVDEAAGMPLAAALLVVLGAVLVAGLFRLARAREWLPFVSFLAVALLVSFNQLLFAAMLAAGLILIGWLRVSDFSRRGHREAALALLGAAVVWAAVAFLVHSDPIGALKAVVGFPDLARPIVYPWVYSMPLMSLLLGLGLLVAFAIAALAPAERTVDLRLLAILVVLTVTVIGFVQPTSETRYSFHAYPIVIVLALAGFSLVALQGRFPRVMRRWAPLACLLPFALSSEFISGHTININSYEANFRVGYDRRLERHYYPRFDYASPAAFVNERAEPTDLILSASVTATHYLERTDAVFVGKTDGRYQAQACMRGEMERWTGLPLLDETGDIDGITGAAAGSRVWLVADSQALGRALPAEYIAKKFGQPVYAAPDGRVFVFQAETPLPSL